MAVSQNRSEDNPLPGVTWRGEAEGFRLDGYKTWIAAVDHVDDLVVRASGEAAGYYLVPRGAPGLSLERNPAPSMLPGLSQGRARLSDVRLSSSRRLDSARVAAFGATEAYFIYVAFAALALRVVTSETAEGNTIELAGIASALLEQAAGLDFADDAESMAGFDDEMQGLRQRLSEEIYGADESWQRDQKLIAMYSKSIQSRVA